jgi:hypothetical protein
MPRRSRRPVHCGYLSLSAQNLLLFPQSSNTKRRESSYSVTSIVSYSCSRWFSLRQFSVSLNCTSASLGVNFRALRYRLDNISADFLVITRGELRSNRQERGIIMACHKRSILTRRLPVSLLLAQLLEVGERLLLILRQMIQVSIGVLQRLYARELGVCPVHCLDVWAAGCRNVAVYVL